MIRLPERRRTLLLVIGGALVLPVFFFFDPAVASFFPPCPVKLLAGLDCPGCGSQRALHALLHLRVSEAFRLNPLALTTIPVLAYDGITGKGPLRHKHAPWVAFAIVTAYWILRNLPVYPF